MDDKVTKKMPVVLVLWSQSDSWHLVSSVFEQLKASATTYHLEIIDSVSAAQLTDPDCAAIITDANQASRLLIQQEGLNRQVAVIGVVEAPADSLEAQVVLQRAYRCLFMPLNLVVLKSVVMQAVERQWLAIERDALLAQMNADRDELARRVTDHVQELLRSQEFLFTLTEVMTDAVFGLGNDLSTLKIEYVNGAAIETFGYTREELIGRRVDILFTGVAKFREYQKALGEVVKNNWHELRLEQLLRKKDGHLIWVENVTTFMFNDGQLLRVISMIRDISRRKEREAEIKQRNEELTALSTIAAALNQTPDLNHVLQTALLQIEAALKLRYSEIWLLNAETNQLTMKIHHGLPEDFASEIPVLAVGKGLPGIVAQTGHPLLITDLANNPKYMRRRAARYKLTGALGIPLMAQEKMVGVMNFFTHLSHPYQFTPAIIASLTHVGHLVGTAIENARLFETERLHRREVEAVQQVSLTLSSSLDLPCVLNGILNAVSGMVSAQDTHIFLCNQGKLTFGAAQFANHPIAEPFADPRPNGLTMQVAQTGKMVVVNDMQAHPLFAETAWRQRGAILGIPLKIGNTVVGVMNVGFAEPRQFLEGELRVLNLLAAHTALAIENARLFEQAQQEIAERKRTEQNLRESEEKYRTLIEQSNDAICLIYNHRLEMVNPKFEALFGFTPASAPDGHFSLADLAVPPERETVEAQLQRQNLPANYAFTAVSRLGREFDVELSISCFPYKTGEAVQGILRDVTERNSVEARLRQAQKMEAVGQLAGGIAHDFNNILTAITGLVALSMDKLPSPSDVYDDLGIVRSQTERAAALVNQLLAFARRKPLAVEPLNLNRIISTMSRLLRQAIGQNVELAIELSPDLYAINAEAGALEQILTNLCFNARDAIAGAGYVAIKTQNVFIDETNRPYGEQINPGNYVLLKIIDTGQGMDQQTLSRIFDPFFTTKETGHGSGLGLAITFNLVKQLEGFIEVESAVGTGSVFNLYFPAAVGVDSYQQNAPENPIAGGSETLLLIEDDSVVLKLIKRVLEQVGYTIILARDGYDALMQMQAGQARVALIIADLSMPKMSGLNLLEAVGSLDLTPKPGFLLMSEPEAEDGLAHPKAGEGPAVGFLAKPFSPALLTAKIREIIEAGQSAKA